MTKYTSYKLLVIDLGSHIVLSSALSCLFYFSTGRLNWVFLCILGGVFIDMDHLIDYFLYFGRRFSLMDFVHHSYLDSGKVYIFFHSWELITILWGISFIGSWLIPLAAGMTAHLIIDQFSWNKASLFYFLLYRRHYGFSTEKLIPSMISRRDSYEHKKY